MSRKGAVTHSRNFERIKGFYIRHLWTKAKVYACVPGQITEAEYEEITGEPYVPEE